MPGTDSYNLTDFLGFLKTGPLPRGNHRHCKGPILTGGAAKKKARKRKAKSRRQNR